MLERYYQTKLLEAGCDEAGRGCLAGAVFAAAVILPHEWEHHLLNDSKKMTARNRLVVRDDIMKNALSWAIGRVEATEIDEMNILNASFLAMERAIKKLAPQPELLLIDGNRFRTSLSVDYICIVGGDGKYASIAAASVLAKTARDEYMMSLSAQFPEYQWDRNMGYPTKAHREAIRRYGVTPHHRLSFTLLQ